MGGLGVAPIAALCGVLALYRRLTRNRAIGPMAIAGVVPALGTLLWAHATYWPLFVPELVAPMFPHGLELVIGPLFFAPVLALAGMLLAWMIQQRGS